MPASAEIFRGARVVLPNLLEEIKEFDNLFILDPVSFYLPRRFGK